MYRRLKERSLVKKLKLIEVAPTGRNFNLFVPSNQKWTFSENDYYEENVVYWFETVLSNLKKTGKKVIFYDIGANCGYYSLLASKLVANIQAFEPSRESFQIFSLNLARNHFTNIAANQVALTNISGELTFHTYSSSGNDSLIKRDIPAGHELQYNQNYKVRAEKLDVFVESHGLPLPSIIKMDIEGAELFALKGGEQVIKKANNPPIIVEYSAATSIDAGYERGAIRDYLIDLGYTVYGIADDNKTKKLTLLSKKGAHENKISNLLAIDTNNKSGGLNLLETS